MGEYRVVISLNASGDIENIYHYIDEENKKINILRLMYDRMNWREYFDQSHF